MMTLLFFGALAISFTIVFMANRWVRDLTGYDNLKRRPHDL